MIKAVLRNASHPEYGQVTIPFPIPDEQYDQTIEMLQVMDLGFSRNRDCMQTGENWRRRSSRNIPPPV